MTYNLTGIDTSNTIFEFIRYVNTDLTNGYASFIFFVLILWIVLLVAFIRYDTKNALIASSFIVTMISILLSFTGMMKFEFIFIPIFMLFASIIAKLLVER